MRVIYSCASLPDAPNLLLVLCCCILAGQPMLGQPVMVKPAEAEKNLAWEAQQAAKQSNIAEAELAALGLAPLAGAAGTGCRMLLHVSCLLQAGACDGAAEHAGQWQRQALGASPATLPQL